MSTIRKLFQIVDDLPDEALKRFQAKLDIIRTLFGALTLLSIISAVIGIAYQWYKDREEVDRRKEAYAQEIINGWDNKTSKVKADLYALIPSFHPGVKETDPIAHTLDKPTTLRIWFAETKDKDALQAQQNITSLLNYYESVSTVFLRDTGDKEMLKTALRGAMSTWRPQLRYYTALADCVRGYKVWPPYYDVSEQWIPGDKGQRQEGTPQRERTF